VWENAKRWLKFDKGRFDERGFDENVLMKGATKSGWLQIGLSISSDVVGQIQKTAVRWGRKEAEKPEERQKKTGKKGERREGGSAKDVAARF
jgi:hypothetical protein